MDIWFNAIARAGGIEVAPGTGWSPTGPSTAHGNRPTLARRVLAGAGRGAAWAGRWSVAAGIPATSENVSNQIVMIVFPYPYSADLPCQCRDRPLCCIIFMQSQA